MRAEAFYAAFARAGWLSTVTWQSARAGALPVEGSARFNRSTAATFDGMAQGYQATIVFPASQFPGLAKGDAIKVVTPEGAVFNYQAHEVHLITGGSQREVTLKK